MARKLNILPCIKKSRRIQNPKGLKQYQSENKEWIVFLNKCGEKTQEYYDAYKERLAKAQERRHLKETLINQ